MRRLVRSDGNRAPGRTGRNQLEAIRAFLRADPPVSGGLLVVACSQGPGRFRTAMEQAGARVFAVDCAGNLHTSTIEFALRAGMAGVMVLSCPPRDCWNREGPRWLHERVYHGREAELKDRVDRRRIRIAAASAGELRETIREVVEFQNALAGLEQPVAEAAVSLELVCEPAASEEA